MALRDATFQAPATGASRPLDRILRDLMTESWGTVRRLIATGKVRVDGQVVLDASVRVAAGARIDLVLAARAPDRGLSSDAILYVDAHVVIVDKPSGVSTVPYDTERGTLDELIRALLKRRGAVARADATLGVVHRLDKETSGLLVFARTLAAKRHLAQQFRRHTVKRRYLAFAHGLVRPMTVRSRLVADRGDGLRGSTTNPKLGRPSVTHVEVLENLNGATFVACRLETGRTHQIRIHLSESAHPLLGERVYVRGFAGPCLVAPRLMLHAAELGFEHPATGRWLERESPLPDDMRTVLDRLRRRL